MTIESGFSPENVFLVVAYAAENSDSAEVFIVPSIAEVNMKLEELTYGNTRDESIKVFNGVITSSLNLPSSFHGVIPHILIAMKPKFSETMEELAMDSEDDDYLILGDDQLYKELEEAFFASGPPDQAGMIEKIETFVDEGGVKIDDILLFFGYELVQIAHVSEDNYDDDEEMIVRLGSIKNDICML